LKAAALELGMTAISAPSERVFGVAIAMLAPTDEGIEARTLSITAIEIQLDQVHTAIAVMTSTLSLA